MLICIDSCAFIHAIQSSDPSATKIFNLIGPELGLVIPRLVAQEVTRNLDTPTEVKRFYQLFHGRDFARIIDEPVPRALVETYANLGLPAKADAFIGAFAEWQQVDYLISDNRHFLRQLQTKAYEVMDADKFLGLIT